MSNLTRLRNEINRRGAQIHLSTALVLALSAGGLLWANLRPRSPSLVINGSISTAHHPCYGYPFGFCYAIPRNTEPESTPPTVVAGGIMINLAFAAAVLFMTGLVCEILIRRSRTLKP